VGGFLFRRCLARGDGGNEAHGFGLAEGFECEAG